jgi:hypothetical protein
MGNMAKLRNWHRDETGHLWGYIHDDPRWPDGPWIRTTTVQAQTRMGEALVARTRNTEYELTREDGGEWFASAGPGNRIYGRCKDLEIFRSSPAELSIHAAFQGAAQ